MSEAERNLFWMWAQLEIDPRFRLASGTNNLK
jgi:hypothetical protein